MTKNTKEKITNAFLNLAQKAQGKTITIGDICKRAGVTRPTFYRYFDTLDALLAELREELDKEVFDVLTSYSPTEQTHSFEIITEQVLPILYANRTKLRIIYTSFVDPQWVKFLETRYAEWMRPFFRGKETLHGLHNDFLVAYITKLVISIISTWLTEKALDKKLVSLFLDYNTKNARRVHKGFGQVTDTLDSLFIN